MSAPTVVCVMLKKDRPEMVKQAVRWFRAQTYPHKRLLIWDSSPDLVCCDQTEHDGCYQIPAVPATIGEMRNEANAFWTEFPIIMHWDDDDYSHPARITEQVALLQSSGAECVGYDEMLFWREPVLNQWGGVQEPGEAWLYRGNALGTSLCYWRAIWEKRPFEALPSAEKPWGAEDREWLKGVKVVKVDIVSAIPRPRHLPDNTPRMIARIHAGNTSKAYDRHLMRLSEMQGSGWNRVPEWDAYCKGIFA